MTARTVPMKLRNSWQRRRPSSRRYFHFYFYFCLFRRWVWFFFARPFVMCQLFCLSANEIEVVVVGSPNLKNVDTNWDTNTDTHRDCDYDFLTPAVPHGHPQHDYGNDLWSDQTVFYSLSHSWQTQHHDWTGIQPWPGEAVTRTGFSSHNTELSVLWSVVNFNSVILSFYGSSTVTSCGTGIMSVSIISLSVIRCELFTLLLVLPYKMRWSVEVELWRRTRSSKLKVNVDNYISNSNSFVSFITFITGQSLYRFLGLILP